METYTIHESNGGDGRQRRLVAVLSRAWTRVSADAWLLLQRTIAAILAWVIATQIIGHDEPFFAPIAAVVALNASLGERGSNALRLLLGVIVGIGVGEVSIIVLGGGTWAMLMSIFAAMTIARALGGAGVTIAQVAAGAILTVASADGQVGPERLVDALVGAGVALVFSQFLFSPEPVALLRRAESAALADMADGLELTAVALEREDDNLDERALTRLRDLLDRLAELARLRRASGRVARHSLVWRSQMTPVVREKESADHLDLLGGSCLMLARSSFATEPTERRLLALHIREIADLLEDLATRLGDREARQEAAMNSLVIARRNALTNAPFGSTFAAALTMVRIVAADIMVFAGVPSDEAAGAILGRKVGPRVPRPPPTPRIPFVSKRRGGHR